MNSQFIAEEKLFKLIQETTEGNTSSFEIIVRSYQYYAYTVAFRVLTNSDEANDVVQESFIKLWKNIGGYNKKVKFTTWMYKIVVNLCYDRLRIRKRETERSEILDESTIVSLSNPEEQLSNKEQAEMIKALSNGLPDKQKMVFVLRDLEGLTTEEVSEIMEISAESVKTNLSLARKAIRIKLIKWRLSDEL